MGDVIVDGTTVLPVRFAGRKRVILAERRPGNLSMAHITYLKESKAAHRTRRSSGSASGLSLPVVISGCCSVVIVMNLLIRPEDCWEMLDFVSQSCVSFRV